MQKDNYMKELNYFIVYDRAVYNHDDERVLMYKNEHGNGHIIGDCFKFEGKIGEEPFEPVSGDGGNKYFIAKKRIDFWKVLTGWNKIVLVPKKTDGTFALKVVEPVQFEPDKILI